MAQTGSCWRKSSYSGNSGTVNCVEVSNAARGIVVRDTTNWAGAILAVSAGA